MGRWQGKNVRRTLLYRQRVYITCICIVRHSRVDLWLVIFFFFFQAEDGIRDIGVTGVQTCALPISALFQLCFTTCRLSQFKVKPRNVPDQNVRSIRMLDQQKRYDSYYVHSVSVSDSRTVQGFNNPPCPTVDKFLNIALSNKPRCNLTPTLTITPNPNSDFENF